MGKREAEDCLDRPDNQDCSTINLRMMLDEDQTELCAEDGMPASVWRDCCACGGGIWQNIDIPEVSDRATTNLGGPGALPCQQARKGEPVDLTGGADLSSLPTECSAKQDATKCNNGRAPRGQSTGSPTQVQYQQARQQQRKAEEAEEISAEQCRATACDKGEPHRFKLSDTGAPEHQSTKLLLQAAKDADWTSKERGVKAPNGSERSNGHFREIMTGVHQHIHQAQMAPNYANLSQVFYADKRNGKSGLLSQRLLHVLDPWFKAFFGSTFRHRLHKMGKVWSSYLHAYLPHRRREGAVAVHVSTSARLNREKLEYLNHLRDMTNAFNCTKEHSRLQTIEEIFPAATEHFMGYTGLVQDRICSPIMRLPTDEGYVEASPGKGCIVGSAEGPTVFQYSYERTLQRWEEQFEAASGTPRITLLDLKGEAHNGNLTCFADDTFEKLVVQNLQADQIVQCVQCTDKHFDGDLALDGYSQNVSKADIVPSLCSRNKYLDLHKVEWYKLYRSLQACSQIPGNPVHLEFELEHCSQCQNQCNEDRLDANGQVLAHEGAEKG